MKRQLIIAAGAALAATMWVSAAKAQHRETIIQSGPNRAMLSTGLFAFGVPYVASVVVAAQSDHQGDKHLYVPIAGPWMDLADRGDCGRLGQTPCDTETGYKVLLVVDGVLQGVGALDIVGAFLFPETRIVRAANEPPRVMIAPTRIGPSGYGIGALTRF
jgi:hypothetical protein